MCSYVSNSKSPRRCTGGCTGWRGGGVRAGVSGAMGARPWAGLGLESTRNPDCQFRWQYAHRSSLAGALDIAQTIIPNPTFNGLLSAGSSRFSGMSALTLFWPTHETRREIKRESRSLGGPSSSAVGSFRPACYRRGSASVAAASWRPARRGLGRAPAPCEGRACLSHARTSTPTNF